MIQNCITAVIGGKGQGKSTWLMEQFLKSERALAFDSRAEYHNCLLVSQRIQLVEYMEDRAKFRVAFRPRAGKEAAKEDLELICRIAFGKGKLDLYLEEIDYFCTSASADPALDRVISYGRDPQINLLYSTRRFQEISKGLTSQTDEYVLFRFAEPADLENCTKRFGKETAERVASLQRFEHIKISVADLPYIGAQAQAGRMETEK